MALKTKINIFYLLKFITIKKFQLFIQIFFLLLIIFNIAIPVLQQKDKYFTFNYWQNYKSYEKFYYDSIYKNKHGNFVRDEFLYTYISGALVKGKSPIFLNPEVPPFGTYIIGSTLLFVNNQHLVIILFAILSLFLMFLVSKQILKSNLVALIPPLFFSFEPIFKNQLVFTPLLDIIQLFFLLCIFYFYNKAALGKTNKQFVFFTVLVNIFLGFFISTKFFGSGVAIVFALLVPFVIHKEWKRLFVSLAMFPIAILVLLLNYLKVLIDGYPLNKFLGIQKWIFLYNTGHLTKPLSIWPLIFLNKWYLSYVNKISFDSQWLITWPILTAIYFLTLVLRLIKKIYKREADVLIFWVLFYFILMSFGDASARYFVILIPILYILGLYGIIEIIKLIRK